MVASAANVRSARHHSGLQKQVLSLYKRALRAAANKDRSSGVNDTNKTTYVFVKERFRDDASSVGRMDFTTIEHLLRKGERDLKMLERMKSAHFTHVKRITSTNI